MSHAERADVAWMLHNSVKVKYFMASRPQIRIYYYCLWGHLSTTCIIATEVAQWATPSCSRLQAATDNGVRGGRYNQGVRSGRRTHGGNKCKHSWAWRHTWQSRQKFTVNRPWSKQWFLDFVIVFWYSNSYLLEIFSM